MNKLGAGILASIIIVAWGLLAWHMIERDGWFVPGCGYLAAFVLLGTLADKCGLMGKTEIDIKLGSKDSQKLDADSVRKAMNRRG